MKSFKQYLKQQLLDEQNLQKIQLFEYEVYKPIPGTKNSYRQDAANTNTMTLKHSHIYAKLGGKGKELYSVNFNGTGHDGSSGIEIPQTHADHFRSLGYNIPPNNILESIVWDTLSINTDKLYLLD
ncbi:hypothetical protein [Aliikangiella maris]|uniref:Uncharacterized protein n=2 Tax=Aliikangiella maris TaxID=3162458 RepID=A0ABV2BW55_9GAMM